MSEDHREQRPKFALRRAVLIGVAFAGVAILVVGLVLDTL